MQQMGFLNEKSTLDKSVVFAKLWDDMSAPKDSPSEERKTSLHTLKVYMCAIQNFIFPWITEPKAEGEEAPLTRKQFDLINRSAIRLHQNRKDFVMRTKNEYYVKVKASKNFYEAPLSFAPQINKPSKKIVTQEDTLFAGKDHAYKLIEKGKEYKEKQMLLSKHKDAA